MLESNEFECQMCNEIFKKARTDEEAMNESKNIFGIQDDLAIICEDCYNKIIPKVSLS